MNVSNCSAYELIEESKISDLNSTGAVPEWQFWKMMMRIKCLT